MIFLDFHKHSLLLIIRELQITLVFNDYPKYATNRWVEGMKARNFASATQGIHLRSCRVVVNRCIGEGYLLPKAYMFGKRRDKVKIPVGASRKGWYLSVPQMQELYAHWKNRDVDFPIRQKRHIRTQKRNLKVAQLKEYI